MIAARGKALTAKKKYVLLAKLLTSSALSWIANPLHAIAARRLASRFQH